MRKFAIGCSALVLSSLAACSSTDKRSPSVEPDSFESGLQPAGGQEVDDMESGEQEGDGTVGSAAAPDESATGAIAEGAPDTTRLDNGQTGDNGDAPAADSEPNNAPDPENTEPEEAEFQPAPASVCGAGPFAESPLRADSVPQIVCSGMGFIEGAVWFSERNTLFFSDIQFGGAGNSGQIFAFTPGGQCETFIENAGTNGLAIAADGNLLGARHGDQTLTVFDLDTREPSVLVADNGGLAFNSPNDIVVRSDGSLYFTDPNYGLGNAQAPQPTRAYWRDPEGALTVIDEGGNANGINLSPDESRLYLSHLGGGADVLVYDVDAQGAPSNPTTFLNVGSDGMAVDCAGNLYITGNGVQIFDPAGAPIGSLDTPGAANVAFGGPERRTLFVTAQSNLFTVEMAIPGMPY